MDKCLDFKELKQAMIEIANSVTDNADHLRQMAAKALHCYVQPNNLNEAYAGVANLKGASDGPKLTVLKFLSDNTHLMLPKYYLHSSNRIALVWNTTPEQEVLLIFDTNKFEFLKIVKGRVTMHREYVGYSYGKLEDGIAKNIPLKIPELST